MYFWLHIQSLVNAVSVLVWRVETCRNVDYVKRRSYDIQFCDINCEFVCYNKK